jgi:exocyst complex protein 7
VLFNTEKKLYNSVFSNQPHISRVVFSDIAQAVIVNFLNFAQAVVLTKPSPEKLFKFLDMYETLRDEV